jgi:excisionase family DNA binding protein
MDKQPNENYISLDEAAEYLGVKTSTVRAWIKSNNMPAHKIGGKLWKFKRSEIDKWVQDKENPLAED